MLIVRVNLQAYWMLGLTANAASFFYFITLLFLGTLCAEFIVAATAWIVPNAVAANACGVFGFGNFNYNIKMRR